MSFTVQDFQMLLPGYSVLDADRNGLVNKDGGDKIFYTYANGLREVDFDRAVRSAVTENKVRQVVATYKSFPRNEQEWLHARAKELYREMTPSQARRLAAVSKSNYPADAILEEYARTNRSWLTPANLQYLAEGATFNDTKARILKQQ